MLCCFMDLNYQANFFDCNMNKTLPQNFQCICTPVDWQRYRYWLIPIRCHTEKWRMKEFKSFVGDQVIKWLLANTISRFSPTNCFSLGPKEGKSLHKEVLHHRCPPPPKKKNQHKIAAISADVSRVFGAMTFSILYDGM